MNIILHSGAAGAIRLLLQGLLVLPTVALVPPHASAQAARQPDATGAPASRWVGSVFLTTDAGHVDTRKILVLSYRFAGGAVTQREVLLAYGPDAQRPSGGNDYFVDLVARNRRVLVSTGTGDPRRMIVEGQGNVMATSATLTVRLPYSPEAESVRLRSATDQVLVDTPLKEAIDRFCAANRTDPDCEAKP